MKKINYLIISLIINNVIIIGNLAIYKHNEELSFSKVAGAASIALKDEDEKIVAQTYDIEFVNFIENQLLEVENIERLKTIPKSKTELCIGVSIAYANFEMLCASLISDDEDEKMIEFAKDYYFDEAKKDMRLHNLINLYNLIK